MSFRPAFYVKTITTFAPVGGLFQVKDVTEIGAFFLVQVRAGGRVLPQIAVLKSVNSQNRVQELGGGSALSQRGQ